MVQQKLVWYLYISLNKISGVLLDMYSFDYDEGLKRIKERYNMGSKELSNFTKISQDLIEKNPACNPNTEDETDAEKKRHAETHHLLLIMAMLIEGYDKGEEDDHLRAYIEYAVKQGFSLEALSDYMQFDLNVLNSFMKGQEITVEQKYTLSVRFFFILHILTRSSQF